jgi:uncharacterized protein
MKRLLINDLRHSLSAKNRKPVVLRGARQVGKTWLVREFAKQENLNLIELNFERNPELSDIFLEHDPQKILIALERATGHRIEKAKSLLFLDEIQKSPAAFANLRWFYEECPELPVVATGSLLDFVLNKHQFSMPVGRISYLFMEPLSFKEFLLANEEEILVEYIETFTLDSKILSSLHEKLLGYFYVYLTIGGMPEAVAEWINSKSPVNIAEIHHSLLNTYIDDFNKYAGQIESERMSKVMNAIPGLLGQKFKYSHVDRNIQSYALKQALELLCLARVAHKVVHSSAYGVPLQAQGKDNLFKVIFLDTGLVSALQGVVLQSEQELAEIVRVNKGGITEQVIGQMLRTNYPKFIDPHLNYYVREKKGSSAEIDYIIQAGSDIIPIEVKAGSSGTLKSLHRFMAERNLPTAVRINSEPPTLVEVKTTLPPTGTKSEYKLLSIPFYLTEEIERLVKEVL